MDSVNSTSMISCEAAVSALREKGYILTDSTIEVMKYGVVYTINSYKIDVDLGRAEIYDRAQYASDTPKVGLVKESGGMCYGDDGTFNYRISSLEEIIERIGQPKRL